MISSFETLQTAHLVVLRIDSSISFWSRLNSIPNQNDSVLATPQTDNWITFNPSGNTNGDGKNGIGVGSIRDASPPLRGVWENYVVSQWLRCKDCEHPSTSLWYWRDQGGNI